MASSMNFWMCFGTPEGKPCTPETVPAKCWGGASVEAWTTARGQRADMFWCAVHREFADNGIGRRYLPLRTGWLRVGCRCPPPLALWLIDRHRYPHIPLPAS